MWVETSAIVAIVLGEDDAPRLISTVSLHERPETSVVNAFEATLAVGKSIGDYLRAKEMVRETLEILGVRMVGVEAHLYDDVVDAYARYGKGTGHPARLNLGDCFSYAMARRSGVPLLYKGNDFSKTDLA